MNGRRCWKAGGNAPAARIAKAVIGLIAVFVLLPIGLELGGWNEMRSVRLAMSFTEGGERVLPVAAGRVEPQNEGRLVHVSGPVAAVGRPQDTDFAVIADGLWLERRVEMYQWQQAQTSDVVQRFDGSGADTVTVFEYRRQWSDVAIDSTTFKEAAQHENPPMPIATAMFPAAGGRIGAFRLTSAQIVRFGAIAPLPLDAAAAARIRARLADARPVGIVDGRAVLSEDPQRPAIGDLRISYRFARPAVGSLIGAQRGDGFEPYVTAAGRTLFVTAFGRVPARDMLAGEVRAGALAVWAVRLIDFLLLLIAFRATLLVAAAVRPQLMPAGEVAVWLVALVPAIVCSTAVMAFAWLDWRPKVAAVIVLLGLAVVAGILFLWRERAASPPPSGSDQPRR